MIMATKQGYSIKFSEKDVRPMGRSASGVRAIKLRDDDVAVCLDIAVEGEKLLVISENGYGKRTPLDEYKLQNRGGMGLITYKTSEKTGLVVGAAVCKADDEMMLINNNGVAIRINVADISVTSRATMGVKLMRTLEDEAVVAIAKIPASEKEGNEEDNDISIEKNTDIEISEDNNIDALLERAESEEDN